MELNFVYGEELGRERRTISAELYNKIHLLFAKADSDSLFVPIRSMQYLAVVDPQEIIFIDGQGRRNVEISWREFQPSKREDLRAPVSYTCVYYDKKGYEIMNRLQAEFLKALQLLEDRQPKGDGKIVPLQRR